MSKAKHLTAVLRLSCAAVALAFVLIPSAAAAARNCGGADRGLYAQALCLYNDGQLDQAENAFSVLVEIGLEKPETIKAHYFLARIAMQQQRWAEANERLIGIYRLSPVFYREWGCDFLLGVARDRAEASK